MKKEDCIKSVDWDYIKYKEVYVPNQYVQKDWNQTLVTRINQSSAEIHIKSQNLGANTIKLNNKVLEILNTLEYYDVTNKVLSGRYKVIIDNSILDDEIYVYNDSDLTNIIHIQILNYQEYDIKDNVIDLLKEDLECVHMYLDELKIPRKDSENISYSIVGRIKQLENRFYEEMSDIETEYLRKQNPTN